MNSDPSFLIYAILSIGLLISLILIERAGRIDKMIKSVVITGHKKHEIGLWSEKHPALPYLKIAYQQKMVLAIEEGAEWFISSGAQGLEQYAIEWLLELKADYSQVKVAMLLPFYGQEKQWKDEAKERYTQLLARADFIDYISKQEYTNPWQLSQKNRFLIERSDGMITFFNGVERTHPWYYLNEAMKKQDKEPYQLWVMNPDDLQNLVDQMREEEF